jgi:L-2-hydroxyglutarate oxidase LhgO
VDEVDAVVIGAGVVGLACAAELARRGRSAVAIERHERPATETTARNSEVIHAGLYYPAGSLKAQSCVEGRALLYERCARRGVPHQRIGKLIVATSRDECEALETIRGRALECGAGEFEILDAEALRRREPRVRALEALWSPDTGIVDAHSLAGSYLAELEEHGGNLALQTRVEGLERRANGWRVHTRGPGGNFTIEAAQVVNAAGLEADRVAELAGIDIDAAGWRVRLCKGDYFGLEPAAGRLTNHLVYPVPSAAGLGVHVTLDLTGRTRFGPDVAYVDTAEYRIDPGKAEAFAAAVRRYLPGVEARSLFPEMAGIRPKLQGPGEPFRDFVVEESSAHGAPGIVHLIGIESPGLTAAGALARRVAELLGT